MEGTVVNSGKTPHPGIGGRQDGGPRSLRFLESARVKSALRKNLFAVLGACTNGQRPDLTEAAQPPTA